MEGVGGKLRKSQKVEEGTAVLATSADQSIQKSPLWTARLPEESPPHCTL